MTEENKEVKPRGKGIGARAMELLIEGKSTQEVIDIVKAEIDGANPTPATIAWYKNKLRQEGKEYQIKDGDVLHFKFNV